MTKTLHYLGLVFIFIGLGKAVSGVVLVQQTDIAFFVSTGIALVVASLLRIKHGVIDGQSYDSEKSIITKNMGYIILGAFILIGLVLLAAPFFSAMLVLLRQIGENEESASDVINAFSFPTGASYYAFLLGVLYFLSPKNNLPK